jgi:hypothetical protein
MVKVVPMCGVPVFAPAVFTVESPATSADDSSARTPGSDPLWR